MRYLLILLLLLGSCKVKQETVRETSVHDTIMTVKHEAKEIILPTKNVTIIDNPCKNDSLISINQVITTDHSTLKISSENGNLKIEQNIDSIVNSKVSEILKHTKKETETVTKTITRYRVPKGMWYFMGVVALYIVYRIARVQFPFLRFLPY